MIHILKVGGKIKLISTQPMIDNETATALIKKWRELLNLEHWRVKLSEQKPKSKNLFEIARNRNRNLASIRISDAAREEGRAEFEIGIEHELLHLLIDLIVEEYDFQKKSLPKRKREEYGARMERATEKCVEHLAYVVDKLYYS